MSQEPAAAPDRQPLDETAAESVRKYAADQRAKVDVLASVLEDIAEHGYPSPEAGVPWEVPATPTSPALPTGRPVSPEHGARRSRVILVEPALTQLAKLTASETHAWTARSSRSASTPRSAPRCPAPCCAITSTRSTAYG